MQRFGVQSDPVPSFCFPGLVNNTGIDWFMPWPPQALHAVAKSFLGERQPAWGPRRRHDSAAGFRSSRSESGPSGFLHCQLSPPRVGLSVLVCLVSAVFQFKQISGNLPGHLRVTVD